MRGVVEPSECPLSSVSDGRFGDERFGRMEGGGVADL